MAPEKPFFPPGRFFGLLAGFIACLVVIAIVGGKGDGIAAENASSLQDWPELKLSWSPTAVVDTLTITESDSATCYIHILPCPWMDNEFYSLIAIITFSTGIQLHGFSPILEGDVIYTPPEDIEIGASADTLATAYHDCPLMTELTLLAQIDLFLDVEEMEGGSLPMPQILPFPIGDLPEITPTLQNVLIRQPAKAPS